jgi:hypothetical protein
MNQIWTSPVELLCKTMAGSMTMCSLPVLKSGANSREDGNALILARQLHLRFAASPSQWASRAPLHWHTDETYGHLA